MARSFNQMSAASSSTLDSENGTEWGLAKGLCLTKLDVLDGLDEVKLCVGYKKADGTIIDYSPLAADDYIGLEPVYETVPGWKESTFGVKSYDALPENAKKYIKKLEEVAGVPVDVISTGPDREETIVLRHPFAD